MGLRPRRAAFLVQRLRGSEQGFTVLETVVALGVILAALVTLAYTANTGFANAAYARQRQTASGLANQTIEQVRALPFDTLKQGMSNFDNLTSDPWIRVVGADYYFTGVTPNEKIARGDIPLNPAVVPLVPHVQQLRVGTASIYTVRAFVTYYNNIQTSNTYRVSVIVTWTQSARKGYARVNAQSLFFSGSGCLSTATHPFAAPCQPFLFGSAKGAEGDISITGTFDDVTVNGSDLRPGGATSDMQIEQISSIQGTTETSGVSLATNGQPENDAGNQGVTSGSDNDPGNAGADFSTATVPAQASTTLSQTAGGGSVYSVTSSGGDTGATTSTASASLNPAHPCQDAAGNAQTDGLPCGASKASQLGTEFASLQLWGAAQKIGTTTIASIGPSPADLYVFTNRANAPEFSYCPGAAGDGCVHADVTRTWGTVALGGLPDSLDATSLPVGWTGSLVTGLNLRTTASAEGGVGSAAPTTNVQGTISYYNGVGYTPLVLAPGPSMNLVIPPVHAQQLVAGKLLTVDISASLATGGTQVVDPAACGTCTRNDASASAASPIVGTVTYQFTYDGVPISTFTMKVDLGLTTAKASYKPAPGA
jgi:type II secretory pathway pseudopilin PulG